MYDATIVATAVVHTVYAALHVLTRGHRSPGPRTDAPSVRDRGAVSLEQVLWFVAAGVSVAVIAAILWNKVRDEANTPIQTPSAP
jgi:hypothetical protein